jgi:hypothetical protein
MAKEGLGDRIEYAILEIIMRHRDGTHRATWAVWITSVVGLEPDALEDELEASFQRLEKGGIVRLSKDGSDYSCNEKDDTEFFYTGSGFDATITADGRKYWGRIKRSGSGTIGFM